MPFPDRLRLPFRFDPVLLAGDLERLSSTPWTNHVARQNYAGHWSVIPLRGPKGETHPLRMMATDPGCAEFADTPLLELCPYYRQVLESFPCVLRSARLMRLGPGSEIKEHCDLDLDVESGTVRLHVPVLTNDAVEFYLNQTRVVLEAGSCWYLRLTDPHRVANRGPTDRVHLVLDASVNEWVRALFTSAGESEVLATS